MDARCGIRGIRGMYNAAVNGFGKTFAAFVVAAILLTFCGQLYAGRILYYVEGENYLDGPDNTVEGIGEKPAASGGASLSGYMLSKNSLKTRYRLPLTEDIDDCVITLRYSCFHWYEKPKTTLKLTLADASTVITHQQDIEPTSGWGSDNPSEWAFAEINLGNIKAGDYILSVSVENEKDADTNIDGFFVSDASIIDQLSDLALCDRLAIRNIWNSTNYIGLSVKNRVIHQKRPTLIEIPVGSFSREGPYSSTRHDITLSLESDTQLPGAIELLDLTLNLNDERYKLATAAGKLKTLSDGLYKLVVSNHHSGMTDRFYRANLEIPITLCGEFIDGFAIRRETLADFAETSLGGDEQKILKADFNYALGYMDSQFAKLNNDKLNSTELANLKRCLSQYERAMKLIADGVDPYKQLTGDLRLYCEDADQQYRIFIPHGYNAETKLPCILALNHTEDKFLDQADGIIKRIAQKRGYAIISPAGKRDYWGEGAGDIEKIVNHVFKQFPQLDSGRLYGTGVSRGGFGTYNFCVTHEDMITAIACVSGVGDNRLENGRWQWHDDLTDRPTLIIQGGIDSIVPVEWAMRISEKLTENDIEHKLKIYPSHGHSYSSYAEQYFTLTLDFFDAHGGKTD